DYRKDIRVLAAQRWPTRISPEDFRRVTGEALPAAWAGRVKDGAFEYDCNTLVSYTVRGVHAKLNVIWDWEAPAGAGDRHYAVYPGRRSGLEVRQSKADNYRPELHVVPNRREDAAQVLAALRKKVAALQAMPFGRGLGVEERGGEIRVTIPDDHRV